jgi:putative metallopeptidase
VTVYAPAPAEVHDLVHHLIATHHPHLADHEIQLVMRDVHATRKGKAVMADTRLIGGVDAWLLGVRGEEEPERVPVIVFAADVWRLLTDEAKAAVTDHELCHLVADEDDDGLLRLVGHDLEEFTAVVGRHGMWRPEVEALVAASQAYQGQFDFAGGEQ